MLEFSHTKTANTDLSYQHLRTIVSVDFVLKLNISVKNACFSKVQPTPLANPAAVVYSARAMKLLDLPETELERDEFPR